MFGDHTHVRSVDVLPHSAQYTHLKVRYGRLGEISQAAAAPARKQEHSEEPEEPRRNCSEENEFLSVPDAGFLKSPYHGPAVQIRQPIKSSAWLPGVSSSH